MRHVLPAKIDAANYAISLVHEDTRAIRATQEGMRATQEGMRATQEGMRATQEGMRATQGGMRATQEGMREKQDQHGTVLEEILRRLPPEPGA